MDDSATKTRRPLLGRRTTSAQLSIHRRLCNTSYGLQCSGARWPAMLGCPVACNDTSGKSATSGLRPKTYVDCELRSICSRGAQLSSRAQLSHGAQLSSRAQLSRGAQLSRRAQPSRRAQLRLRGLVSGDWIDRKKTHRSADCVWVTQTTKATSRMGVSHFAARAVALEPLKPHARPGYTGPRRWLPLGQRQAAHGVQDR